MLVAGWNAASTLPGAMPPNVAPNVRPRVAPAETGPSADCIGWDASSAVYPLPGVNVSESTERNPASIRSPEVVLVRLPLLGEALVPSAELTRSSALDAATPEYSRIAKRKVACTVWETV